MPDQYRLGRDVASKLVALFLHENGHYCNIHLLKVLPRLGPLKYYLPKNLGIVQYVAQLLKF